MYILVFILLLGAAFLILSRGFSRKKVSTIVSGVVLGVLTLLFFWFMDFWGEKLWFDNLGYNDRFWTVWLTKLSLFVGAFLVGGLIIYLLTYSVKGEKRLIRWLGVAVGAFLSAFWWFSRWEIILKFMNATTTGITDPILNQDTGFYLFNYPFLEALYTHLFLLGLIAIATSLLGLMDVQTNNGNTRTTSQPLTPGHSLFISTGVTLLILAFGKYIARFGLLFSQFGIVSGPGWTDVIIRLPMLWVVFFITLAGGIGMMIPTIRNRMSRLFGRQVRQHKYAVVYTLPGAVFLIWLVLLVLVPFLVQWLRVEPNEITVEKEYITHNINFTRQGYHLNKVEEREFPVSEEFTKATVENNKDLFDNIRLWDYRALDAVFKQFQEIRLYYEFHDVDIDRYMINDEYREVMVSAREMQPANLPVKSQTFVNKRFKYTHGYGAVMSPVNEFTPEGLPNFYIKDIPPVSEYENVKISKPGLYYGELSTDYVVVNSEEEEFDYPSGESNVYTRYEGEGGVQISNFWRKLIYGWKHGRTRFLLSGYPTEESRIMMHRHIVDRAENLAPFLYYDEDPYVVVANGRMYWIIDAYTHSKYYPYSEPFATVSSNKNYRDAMESLFEVNDDAFGSNNYIRNSVKVVIDSYSGETDFYIFEKEDPMINVYNEIFPGLLKPREEMPENLQKHVRYPADMLLIQGLVYAKYHMTDPAVFYNQEDLWVRATEKYYNNVQPVEPYYIMWKPAESDKMEFVLILPFTPKNKQVMIGWIAGMCDGENYGRFLAYKFPKEKRILGTQQVETKIDQDSYLSGQLTLWDQRGSNVIRGNVLAIPVNQTIVYVEPIYLQSETSAYPELRLVAVMHNDNLSYAENFDEALRGLYSETIPAKEGEPSLTGEETPDELIQQANDAFESYLELMQQKRFIEAGQELQKLEESLKGLSGDNEQ